MSSHTAPRSYIIQTLDGIILQWNRHHLRIIAEQVPIITSDDDAEDVIQDDVNSCS